MTCQIQPRFDPVVLHCSIRRISFWPAAKFEGATGSNSIDCFEPPEINYDIVQSMDSRSLIKPQALHASLLLSNEASCSVGDATSRGIPARWPLCRLPTPLVVPGSSQPLIKSDVSS